MGAKRPWAGDFYEIVASGTAKFGAKALMMVPLADYRATRAPGDSARNRGRALTEARGLNSLSHVPTECHPGRRSRLGTQGRPRCTGPWVLALRFAAAGMTRCGVSRSWGLYERSRLSIPGLKTCRNLSPPRRGERAQWPATDCGGGGRSSGRARRCGVTAATSSIPEVVDPGTQKRRWT